MPFADEQWPRTPFLEDTLSPDALDLVWDNWRSQPEDGASPYDSLNTGNTCSMTSFEDSTVPPTPSSAKSTGSKRWGFFSRKRTLPETPTITVTSLFEDARWDSGKKKENKVLRKKPNKQKSTPNLKPLLLRPGHLKIHAYHGPFPRAVSRPLCTRPSPRLFPIDGVVHESGSSDSTVYFTVDPEWDVSKGDANVYFLPFQAAEPDVGVMDHQDGPVIVRAGHVPRQRAQTHIGKAPKTSKAVAQADNETSFLFID